MKDHIFKNSDDFNDYASDADMQQLRLSPVTRRAYISECEKYRYQLYRRWDESLPMVMFLMLNPSTADANIDDPTIRRCIAFARSWGFGGLYVGNLFAFRSTDPKEILKCEEPIGSDNSLHLKKMASKCELIVCAWGNSPIVDKLGKRFGSDYLPLKGLTNLRYLELSNDGTPKHPLYLKGDLIPQEFNVSVYETSLRVW